MADAPLCLGKMDTRGTELPLPALLRLKLVGSLMGVVRIYTQLSAERVQKLAEDRREAGGRVDAESITAEEVLAQTNKVFAPYQIKFASSMSWFAVWKSRSFIWIPHLFLFFSEP